MDLLAWYTVTYWISLAFGAMAALGMAAGLDGDFDLDGDVESDHTDLVIKDAQTKSLVLRGLGVLGIGKVPITMVILISALIYGGFGIAFAFLGLVSFPIALFAMLFFTGRISKAMGRFLPSVETYGVKGGEHFVNLNGKSVITIGKHAGMAQIRDLEGNLHQIVCRSEKRIRPNTHIVVEGFDRETKRYWVREADQEERSIITGS